MDTKYVCIGPIFIFMCRLHVDGIRSWCVHAECGAASKMRRAKRANILLPENTKRLRDIIIKYTRKASLHMRGRKARREIVDAWHGWSRRGGKRVMWLNSLAEFTDTFKIFPRVFARIGSNSSADKMKRTECATWTGICCRCRHRRRSRPWNRRISSAVRRVEVHAAAVFSPFDAWMFCSANVREMTKWKRYQLNDNRKGYKWVEPETWHAMQLPGIFPLNTGISPTCHSNDRGERVERACHSRSCTWLVFLVDLIAFKHQIEIVVPCACK